MDAVVGYKDELVFERHEHHRSTAAVAGVDAVTGVDVEHQRRGVRAVKCPQFASVLGAPGFKVQLALEPRRAVPVIPVLTVHLTLDVEAGAVVCHHGSWVRAVPLPQRATGGSEVNVAFVLTRHERDAQSESGRPHASPTLSGDGGRSGIRRRPATQGDAERPPAQKTCYVVFGFVVFAMTHPRSGTARLRLRTHSPTLTAPLSQPPWIPDSTPSHHNGSTTAQH